MPAESKHLGAYITTRVAVESHGEPCARGELDARDELPSLAQHAPRELEDAIAQGDELLACATVLSFAEQSLNMACRTLAL